MKIIIVFPNNVFLQTMTTHILNYATLFAFGLSGSCQTPGLAKGNLGLISLSHSTWLKTRKRKIKLQIHPACSIVQLHQEQKEELISWEDKANTCDQQSSSYLQSLHGEMLPSRSGILAEAMHCIHLFTTKTIYFSRFVLAMYAFAPVEIFYSSM